jgi:hypothetical protein
MVDRQQLLDTHRFVSSREGTSLQYHSSFQINRHRDYILWREDTVICRDSNYLHTGLCSVKKMVRGIWNPLGSVAKTACVHACEGADKEVSRISSVLIIRIIIHGSFLECSNVSLQVPGCLSKFLLLAKCLKRHLTQWIKLHIIVKRLNLFVWYIEKYPGNRYSLHLTRKSLRGGWWLWCSLGESWRVD